MIKKCLSLLLAVLITISLLTVCSVGANAEETVVSVVGAVVGDDYPGDGNRGFYYGECTSFVAWRMESQNHIQTFKNGELVINDTDYSVFNTIDIDDYGNFGGTVLGHAKYWGTAFRSMGFPVDLYPKVGSIAWTTNGTYGHVAWVASIEKVDISTEEGVTQVEYVTVEEYNAGGGYHRYGTRRRTTQEWIDDGYQFIHVKDILNIPDNAVRSGIFGLNSGWYLNEDGVLNILGIGEMKDYPQSDGQYAPWYNEREKITGIVIEKGITSIGICSFMSVENLTNIVIPDSVLSIKTEAFGHCIGLEGIVIPETVTFIGEMAFYDCISLKKMIIPDGVNCISDSTFFNCENLTSVTIPDTVTRIEDEAFEYCSSITRLDIPLSVRYIGQDAFLGCNSLEFLRLPNSLSTIEAGTFYKCSSLKSVIIPVSVSSINKLAFYHCDKLEDVYYTGSAEEWNCIDISSYYNGNSDLDRAQKHYGCFTNHFSQLFIVDESNIPIYEVLPNGQKANVILFAESLLELLLNDSFLLTAQSTDAYRWYSTDESVVTVENGNITAVSPGEVLLIAETVNGARAICKVVVKPPVMLGDVDGDDEVTIIDATCIQRKLANIPTAKFIEAAADADEDGSLSIIDATTIQRWLAQLPSNNNIGKPIS